MDLSQSAGPHRSQTARVHLTARSRKAQRRERELAGGPTLAGWSRCGLWLGRLFFMLKQRNHAVELVERLILDSYAATAPVECDVYAQSKMLAELPGENQRIGIVGMRCDAVTDGWFRLRRASNEGFRLADVEAARNDDACCCFRFGVAEKRSCMTGGQRTGFDMGADRGRQLQETQRVGDMAARFSDGGAELFLCECEFLDEPAIAFRFFDGIEVVALQVFDEGGGHRVRIGQGTNEDGNVMQADRLRCAPAAFSGDDLIEALVLGMRPDQERLQYALLLDGGC